MPSPPTRRGRAAGLVPILLVASCAVIAVQIAAVSHAASPRSNKPRSAAAAFHRVLRRARTGPPTTTTSNPPTTTTTSTTSPPPAPPATTTTVPPPPPQPVVAPRLAVATVPPEGQASGYGCGAALAYLSAYAHPGFTFECPGYAQGREGMTCANEPGICPNEHLIAIADACPAVYMNEASNSWVLMGQSSAPIDPYGSC